MLLNIKNNFKFIHLNSFLDIVNKYQYFIFDCDGVVWRESKVMENCVETIKILMSKNKQIFFLSNTNRSSRYDMQEKFNKICGLEIDFKNIYTSSYLTAKYISELNQGIENLYVVGSAGLERELEEKGFKIYGGAKNKNIKYIEDFNSSRLEELEIDENIQACVVGYDDAFNYFKIAYASHIIHKTGLFFGTNYDRFTKVGNKFSPGTNTFISALEGCTDKKAQVVTKPDPRSLSIIMSDHGIDLNLNREKILMIGDNMNTDILFANNNKIDSLLVLTGVTSEENILKIESEWNEVDVENNYSKITAANFPKYVLKSF
jgi:4-nitrophenyl phosphatase